MNKRKMSAILLSLTLLSGLFSCGEKTEDRIIHFWYFDSQTINESLKARMDEFMALVKQNEGVDVQIELDTKGGDYASVASNIESGFSVGNIPTIAVAYPDTVAQFLADEKTDGQYVVNMADFASDETVGFGKEAYLGDAAASDFVDSFYQEGTKYAKEGLYSLPLMKSTEVMFYNKDLVSSGLSKYFSINGSDAVDNYVKNMSWDNFMNVCKVFKQHLTDINNNLEIPAYYDSDSNLYISQSYQNNIPFISLKSDGSGSLDFVNDKAKAMVKALYDNSKSQGGLFTTKGVEGTYGSDTFKSAKCLFSVGSSGGAGYNLPEGDTFQVGVCKVPYANNNPLYVSQGPALTMLRNPGESDELNDYKTKYAWKFLKYLTSAEVNGKMCANDSNGYVPVRKSAYETDFYKTFLEGGTVEAQVASIVKNDISGHYFVTPAFKGSATARTAVGNTILTQVFLGNSNIDDAFTKAYNDTLLQM